MMPVSNAGPATRPQPSAHAPGAPRRAPAVDVRVLLQVLVPVGMLGGAALRRDDHVAVAVLLVDEWLRARLAALAALRRQQQDLCSEQLLPLARCRSARS